MASLRYAKSIFNVRTLFMKLCGKLQGRDVIVLNSHPELCSRILASSNRKGQGIELMLACPAWKPVLSIESVDGEDWEWLSSHFTRLYKGLNTKDRIPALCEKYVARAARDNSFVLDGEEVSRLTAFILFELVFSREMSPRENDLFYQASLEWRKEIAIKGEASSEIKAEFWESLTSLIRESRFAEEFSSHTNEADRYRSLFAQPLFLSPQINVSDIFASLFRYLEENATLYAKAKAAALGGDRETLQHYCLETIRLKHPFPVLERELTRKLNIQGREVEAGTHVYIALDEFDQDPVFQPARWERSAVNPYRGLPFGTGQRMCLGKDLALELMSELLTSIFKHIPASKIRTASNHAYSGRDNDGKDSWATILYQLKIFGRALKTSMQIGAQRKAELKCPFKARNAEG